MRQHYEDEPPWNNNAHNVDFNGVNHNSKSFKYKQKITGKTNDDGEKNVKTMGSIKIFK